MQPEFERELEYDLGEFAGSPESSWIRDFATARRMLALTPFVDPSPFGVEPGEQEFRLDRLPPKSRSQFVKGGNFWREAVAEAMRGGIVDPSELADLIFFMQHPARIKDGVGKLIDKNEADFVKLRAEWGLYRTIAAGLIKPATAKLARELFLPSISSRNYEDYVCPETTGRITLMVNGRSGSGPKKDVTDAFDNMQRTVESLGPDDTILIASWQFIPTELPLTLPSPTGLKIWGDLLKRKAEERVKIRAIVSDLPPAAAIFRSDLDALNALINLIPAKARDNFKYISSPHPASLVASHHQKVLVARKGATAVAYCGGLDISRNRTPAGWSPSFVWHDVHAKIEGRIVRDIEREFVLRWNREKDKSTGKKLPGWKDFETLAQAPPSSADGEATKNTHKLQMLRTVSFSADSKDIKRDDIWQGYFRLIGSATRFLFMENQYFHEPKMADAIVKQAQAQVDLIVLIVVSSETDDPDNPITEHMRAMRSEFFTRLFAGLKSSRVRVYTMVHRLVHSKLILVDDQALSMGSANANPRGFFLDTELNVMLDDAEAVKNFRQRLWAHDLGVPLTSVAAWAVPDFFARWDAVAKANDGLRKTPGKMAGEGVVPFDPRVKGPFSPLSRLVPDVLTER